MIFDVVLKLLHKTHASVTTFVSSYVIVKEGYTDILLNHLWWQNFFYRGEKISLYVVARMMQAS